MRRAFKALMVCPVIFAVTGTGPCIPADHVDITVFLKDMNQVIAPVGLSCPEWHYRAGSAVECMLENADQSRIVTIVVSPGGISFVDPSSVTLAIAELS